MAYNYALGRYEISGGVHHKVQVHSVNSSKLAGIKYDLYNPRLPTLRQMDRDDVMNKLSTEHSRTTTALKKDDFLKGKSSIYAQGGAGIHGKTSMHNDVLKLVHSYRPVHVHNRNQHTDAWNQIMSSLMQHENKESRVSGLCIRKKHPDITSSWQTSRPSRAHVTMLGQVNTDQTNLVARPRPQLPALLYTRHRGCASNKCNPWR